MGAYSFYLAHPFDSREWELKFEKETGITLLNPFYDTERTYATEIDKTRRERYEIPAASIVKRDLDLIKEADGVVAFITGDLSYGTIMEIVYGYLLCKSVYLIVTNGHEGHPWLRYHAKEIFTSVEAFQKYIMNGGKDEG